MILHDFRCRRCHKTEEHFVRSDEEAVQCPHCTGTAERVILKAPAPDWLRLAQGDSASPEAIDKFDRMHRQQKAKEEKTKAEHGDYGPRPGAD